MASSPTRRLRRPALEPAFLVLCAALTLALVRATDLPSLALGLAGTDVDVTPGDVALLVLALVCAVRVAGGARLPQGAGAPAAAAAAFSGYLLVSAALNGATAFVAGAKLLEYAALAAGVVLLVQVREQLRVVVAIVAAFAVAAAAWGLLGFLGLSGAEFPGRRQDSFTGQHELTLLSSLTLGVALASLYAPAHRLPRPALLVAGAAAAVGVVLGAALAGWLGFLTLVAAVVAVAALRGTVTRRALVVTGLVTVAVSAGVLGLRSGDLAAFTRFLGVTERSEVQEENVAGWNERLVYAYVGGRIFLDRPLLGTGWHGELPPEEYVRYLPDARRRFPDVPARYLPPRTGFVPQQTYDQVLYELGLVGAVLFLVLGLAALRPALAVTRRWPRADPDEPAAYLPLAWAAALAWALAGAALFGGSALPAVFWLVLGLAAVAPSLVPPAEDDRPDD